ncbi:SSS family solute:Na+ symporter [Scopulibacillus darangshiensis]|uniref:SSS family solute:Na+ symporter n=1 Tax=Scopulibacillus darangshiensis TaxID=442528 RepID=A0A4V2SKJ3_9BACL|nr:sodium:solute symporter [Scopulibacillus darangshiensis]TCP19526.1 SSS family solute:Na+ symporter [Scopulibacillus darangshiensis]
METSDTIVLLLYFAVLIVVGIIGSRKSKSSEDYVLAGRRLGVFMNLGCLSAVIIGGASTLGTTSLGYQYGISGIWLVVMIGLGIMALGIFVVKKISGYKVLTISELLGKRYNNQTRLISAVVTAIYTLLITVTQIIGMGAIINVLLDWNLTFSMLLGGGIVLFYTILGGMWSVTVTDIIQFVVMTIGLFFIMLPMSLAKAGGFDHLLAELPDSYFSFTNIGVDQIFQYFLLYFFGLIVSQDIWQRVFTAKNTKTARISTASAGLYSIAYALAAAVIGMCALLVLPDLTNTQNTFASMAIAILPSGMLGIILASVCSALMSTASGGLIASATLISNDIIKEYFFPNIKDKQFITLSRITTLGLGLISIIFALWIQDILVALDVAYAILSGAIFVPLLAGLFWKKATAKGSFYSIIVSTIVILVGFAIDGLSATSPIIYGIVASVITMVSMSLLDKKTSVPVIKKGV